MGADEQSRRDIAEHPQAASYRQFVNSLFRLPTMLEIRQSITGTPGLDGELLEQAVEQVAGQWRLEKRTAGLELLDYVKQLIAPLLPARPAQVTSITGPQSLLALLLQPTTALHMRSALRAHRHLVNQELLELAEAQLARSQLRTTPDKELGLALYLIARVMNDRKKIVRGLLIWSAFCRQHDALRHAERHLARASEMARALNDSVTRLTILGARAGLLRAMESYQDACTVLEEGLRLAQTENSTALIGGFAEGLVSCYRTLGQTAKALDATQPLLDVADQVPGKKSRALNLRGLLYEDLGRYETGALDYDEAVKAAAAEGDRSQQFVAMNNAAASLLKRGMARDAYYAFVKILQQAQRWANPLMVASTRNNLGHALAEMGNFAAARSEFFQALHSKLSSQDRRGEMIAFLGIAECERALGNPESARTWATMAFIPALESGDAGLIGQAQLAMTQELLPDDDLAQTLKSLRSARDNARGRNELLIEALLVRRIALLLRKAGRADEALEECQELLSRRSSGSALDTALLQVSIEYATLLSQRQESWQAALDMLLSHFQATEKMMDETLIDARLGEIAAAARPLCGALLQVLNQPHARAVANRSPSQFAFDLHESAKARTLLAHMADTAVFVPPPEVPRALSEKEAALLAEERNWQEGRVTSEAQRAEKLATLRTQLKECWQQMAPIAPDYVRVRSGQPYAFSEVLKALRTTTGAHVALVSFFVAAENTTCFVVRTTGDEPTMLSFALGEEALAHAARQLQRTFNGAPDEFPPYPPIRGDMPFKRSLDPLEKLSETLRPLLALLEEFELICVAPQRSLHAVPLHALQLSNGQYLAEKCAVVYAPSLSVALSKSHSSPAQAPSAATRQRAFVVGISSADDLHPEYFEADEILFDPSDWEVTRAVGIGGAHREAVLSGLHGNRAVHISCHAFFNPRNPQESGLIVSDGVARAPRDLSRVTFMERQSFLVRVRDLMRIHLDCELITLSACSTGMQRERNGSDELEGFARALLGAGAGSALLALWNVDQASSHQLLASFYDNWSRLGMPKWRALQATQRQLIAQGGNLSHPYHWAPFVLIGGWS